MRIRITDNELSHYASAKRDNKTVNLGGQKYHVTAITTDALEGFAPAGQTKTKWWWVELEQV